MCLAPMVRAVSYFSSTDYSSWNTHIILKRFSFIKQANSNAYSTSLYKKFWLGRGQITSPLYRDTCGHFYCTTERLGDSSTPSAGIPASASRASEVVVLVPDLPCCDFYINALNETLYFRSLQQIKFMPINLTLRFPPCNRESLLLLFWTILLPH